MVSQKNFVFAFFEVLGTTLFLESLVYCVNNGEVSSSQKQGDNYAC